MNSSQLALGMILREAKIKNEWDSKYQPLLKKARSLPWDQKPRKMVTSALHELVGEIGGKEVGFSWHQPDKWGDDWLFLGMYHEGKILFDKSAKSDNHKSGPWTPPTPEFYKKNVKDFESALAYASKLTESLSESDLEEDSNAIKKLNKAYGSKLAIGSDPKNMIDNTWVGVSKSKRGVILEPFDRDATTKLYKSLKKNGIKAMISKKSHQILVLDEGAVIEGGPGSGVKYRNTAPIPMLQSPYVSVGTRKSMLQNMDYEEREVSLSQITHCCQKNYVPSKLEKFIKNPDWIADSPIDVLHVPGEGYHVVDGHHRYLAANALNMGTIPAKVYHKSEKSMPDYDADQGVAVELDGIHEEQAPMGCKCPQCMEKREFGEHPDQSPTFMRSYPEKAPDPYSLADKFRRELKMKLGQLDRPVNASLSLGSPMGGNTSMG